MSLDGNGLSPETFDKVNNIKNEVDKLMKKIANGIELDCIGWVCRDVDPDTQSSNCKKHITFKKVDVYKETQKICDLNDEMNKLLRDN